MSKDAFRYLISAYLWQQEFEHRLAACKANARLEFITTELTQLAAEDLRTKKQRTRWPGAPYISFVDSKFHARLLAMTRLGLLPIQIEVGRWRGVPREQRLCCLGCGKIEDTDHFLNGCAYIETKPIDSLNRYTQNRDAKANPLKYWRDIARRLECRWRERTHKVRCAAVELHNPADARDDKFAEDIDAASMQQISQDDIRFYLKST